MKAENTALQWEGYQNSAGWMDACTALHSLCRFELG
jgi:hypothetical protein